MPLAVVDQQPIRAAQRANHEVGIAIRVVVEERNHVVVLAHVGRRRPPRLGGVAEAALAVVPEHVLAAAGAVPADDLAVVHRHQVEEAVAVQVHRLELVVVGVLRQTARVVREGAGAIVAEQIAPPAPLAGDEDVEVRVVVHVGQLEVPREAHLDVGHARAGGIREPAGAVVEPQACPAALVRHVVAGAPVGQHQVQVAVAVHVARLQVADAERHRRQVSRGDLFEPSLAAAKVQAALRLVGRADDDVGNAVAVEIPCLDDARKVRRRAQHLRRRLPEAEAGPEIQEYLVRLGRAGRRVVAAVGEQQVGPPVSVEVGNLHLVGPEPGLADGLVGHVHPQRTCGWRGLGGGRPGERRRLGAGAVTHDWPG
jgi:hypothetical protein